MVTAGDGAVGVGKLAFGGWGWPACRWHSRGGRTGQRKKIGEAERGGRRTTGGVWGFQDFFVNLFVLLNLVDLLV